VADFSDIHLTLLSGGNYDRSNTTGFMWIERSFHNEWYVIPLLAIVAYIYTKEIKEARRTGNWDAVLAGLTVFGADFLTKHGTAGSCT